VALLTFAVVLVNALIWRAWEAWRRRPRGLGWAAPAALVLAVWAVAAGYGHLRLREVAEASAAAERSLRVGVVQGNVANGVRLAWARGDDRAAEKQLSAYLLPTEEWIGREPPLDLVVWPETAFPGIFQQPASAAQRGRGNKFDRQVLRLEAPIVFGAYDRERSEDDPALFNALFAITPKYDRPGARGIVHRYRKHELLPFAETIPGVSRDSWLHSLLPRVGFFGRGEGTMVFGLTTPRRERVRIAPAICSESLSATHAIDGARLGADLLLNAGSDGWFGPGGEPAFHLAGARLRSVETRLPQVRAANTGISALILPDGAIPERSAFGVATTLELDVPLAGIAAPPFVRWGDWVGRAAIPAAAAFLLALALTGRSGRADSHGE
jgi:apolipoprotein N-acyltransferase